MERPLNHMIIIQNILESPYKTKVGDLILYFYTERHKKLFDERIKGWVDKINSSLSSRFSYCIDAPEVAAIQLYSRIENYGFCIEFDKEIYRNIAEFNGRFIIKKVV